MIGKSATLYQVSTASALAYGVTDGAIRADALRDYGDFGIGTIEDLDGTATMVDGSVFQAHSDGSVSRPDGDVRSAFIQVTQFLPNTETYVERAPDFVTLLSYIDPLRHSENFFYAVRIEGVFDYVYVGSSCTSTNETVSVCEFRNVRGTLVGFWMPGYAKMFTTPGYHLHFISFDRAHGGHLVACSGSRLRYTLQQLTDFHVALPSTRDFLKADLPTII